MKHNIKEMPDWLTSSADWLCNELRSKMFWLLCIVGLDWVSVVGLDWVSVVGLFELPGQGVAQEPGQVPKVVIRDAVCDGGLIIRTLEVEERKEESIRGGEDDQQRDEDLHVEIFGCGEMMRDG